MPLDATATTIFPSDCSLVMIAFQRCSSFNLSLSWIISPFMRLFSVSFNSAISAISIPGYSFSDFPACSISFSISIRAQFLLWEGARWLVEFCVCCMSSESASQFDSHSLFGSVISQCCRMVANNCRSCIPDAQLDASLMQSIHSLSSFKSPSA